MASILICFDIENAVVRDAVLARRPRVIFTREPTVLNVFIDTDDDNRFARHVLAPKRPRTKIEDNTGAVCQTRLFTTNGGNNDTTVESFALPTNVATSAATSTPVVRGVVFAVFGRKLHRLNLRDGSRSLRRDDGLHRPVCAEHAAFSARRARRRETLAARDRRRRNDAAM
jgi:hypothetical protein